MAKKKNPKCIIFLHEGYTEIEFYNKIFEIYLPKRQIRFYKYNLKGIGSNLNKKVRARINWFLSEKNKNHEQEIYLICAYDREGPRDTDTLLNIDKLRTEFTNSKRSRIKQIEEIVATQDLESWFFHDLNGIYNFLKVPKKDRKLIIHDVEKTNNKILAQLFRKYGKVYRKRGEKVKGFIESLDLKLIYKEANDLQDGILEIIEILNK